MAKSEDRSAQSEADSGVTLRPAHPDDDARIIAIDNRIAAGFPPTTVEEMRFFAANRPAGTLYERYVAERDGRIVGSSLLREMWWVEEPDSYSGQVTVDPDHRRRGVGSRLYEALEGRVRELGGRTIYGRIRDDLLEDAGHQHSHGLPAARREIGDRQGAVRRRPQVAAERDCRAGTLTFGALSAP